MTCTIKSLVFPTQSASAYIGFVPWIEKVLAGGWLRKPAVNRKAHRWGITTPLEYAAEQGHGAAMKRLLERGAAANWCNGRFDGLPPFHIFAASGNEMAIRICIEHGADLAAAGLEQWTPLHRAAESGHHAVVQLLLDAGVDCEAKDIFQKTALMWAAERGYGAVVQALLKFEAKVGTTDCDGASALDLAAAERQYHVMTMLSDRGAPLNDAAALWLAATRGNEVEVKLLLDRGVPVDVKIPTCTTALYYAAIKGHDNVVQVLLDRGAKIEAIAEAFDFIGGSTVLHAMFDTLKDSGSFGRFVQLCCNSGVDVNAVDDKGYTVLDLVIKYALPSEETACKTKLQALLQHGAKVDIQDERGWISLHHAARQKLSSAVIGVLLDHGAQVDARDHTGQTPLHLAACSNLRLDSTHLLLDHGADVNARDNQGLTPLHLAAQSQTLRMGSMQMLLDHGADINARDNEDRTPLDCAHVLFRPLNVELLKQILSTK